LPLGARIAIAILAVVAALIVAIVIVAVRGTEDEFTRRDAPARVPATFPLPAGAVAAGVPMIAETYRVTTADAYEVHQYYVDQLGSAITKDLLLFVDFSGYDGYSGELGFANSGSGAFYSIKLENVSGSLVRVPSTFPVYPGASATADQGAGPALEQTYVIDGADLQATIDFYVARLGDALTSPDEIEATTAASAGGAGRLLRFSKFGDGLSGSVDVHTMPADTRVHVDLQLEY
jgi:hypothetical protein